jgi:cell division protein FtsQ
MAQRRKVQAVNPIWGSWGLFALKIAVTLVFLLGLLWALLQSSAARQWLAWLNQPITSVKVQGEFQFVSQARLETRINEKLGASFLDINLSALKRHLEADPLIEKAVVARQWPSTLAIKIYEQQPIARWNQQAFLNSRADIIAVEDPVRLAHLPQFRGDDRYAARVMEMYVSLARLLSHYQFAPLVLEIDNTLAWTLIISPDIVLKLGREDVPVKLKRILQVLRFNLQAQLSNMSTLDARYQEGFAIGWKHAADSAEENNGYESTH